MSTMSIEQQLESLERRQKEIQRNKLELSRKLKQREKAEHAKRVKMIGDFVLARSEKGSAELQAVVIAYLNSLSKKSEQELFSDYFTKYGIKMPGSEQAEKTLNEIPTEQAQIAEDDMAETSTVDTDTPETPEASA